MTNATNSHKTNQMDPITKTEYDLIVRTAQSARPGETQQQAALRASVDIAAIGTMRDGLLRTIEAAEARWRDLSIAQDGSGLLTITVSKVAPGHVVYVSPTSMTALGEMRSTKQAMGIDTEQDDRIFQMGSHQLARRIRNACAFAGLQGRYGGLSPRIGMETELARSGVSVVGLVTEGRWRNPTMANRFFRNIKVSDGAVAQWHARNQSTDTPA